MVITDMIRLEPYARAVDYDCVNVMDMDDLLSERYKRQLNAMTSKTKIAGAYEDKLIRPARTIMSFGFAKKCVLKLEISRMKKAEEKAYKQFDRLLFVSKKETNEMNRRFSGSKAIAIGLGVDFVYFSAEIEVKKEKNTACFVGNMHYPPNADSLRYICDEILPLSKNVERLIIIGKYPDELKDEFKENKKIVFLGRVDDLRVAVESSTVFLSPIVYGTGIKTKILEAMAMGMPVITNNVGAEGIDAVNGEDILVTDDSKNMAEKLDMLFTDEKLRCKLSRNAVRLAKENYDWNVILRNFERIKI